jgi:hypothetical protein
VARAIEVSIKVRLAFFLKERVSPHKSVIDKLGVPGFKQAKEHALLRLGFAHRRQEIVADYSCTDFGFKDIHVIYSASW